MVGSLVAEAAARCRAEPGDLCGYTHGAAGLPMSGSA
jgi:hypothetical protein